MIFLQPWWWLLALLALPLLLLRHKQRPRQTVPSLYLWRDLGAVATGPQPRLSRPKLDTTSILLLGALLAVIVALAGPRMKSKVADHAVFVLDLSVSMGATLDERSRLDLALEGLRHSLSMLDPETRGGPKVTLVTVDAQVNVVTARSGDAREALASLTRFQATASPDSVPWPWVAEVLSGLTLDDERTHLTVYTDGAGEEVARRALSPLSPGQLTVMASGDGAASWGLAAVRAVQVDPERGQWIIEGEVVAYPTPAEPLTIELRYQREGLEGDVSWARRSLRLRAERTAFSFETSVPTSGILSVHLPPDVQPTDNTARIGLTAVPVPLRVAILGAVPETVSRALGSLQAAQIIELAGNVDMEEHDPFDLAVVAGDVRPTERPAATVLWMGGAIPDGPRAERVEQEVPVKPGAQSLLPWSAVLDMPPAAPTSSYRVLRLPGAEVLLDGPAGPLLQVRSDGVTTDLIAAWDLGTTAWTNELGFSVLITELARNAQERYGEWTLPRCIAGRRCTASPSGYADGEPGLHGDGLSRWIVDGEAGSESDLRVPGTASQVPARAPFPNRTTDSALFVLAAALIGMEAGRSLRRRLPLSRARRRDSRSFAGPALTCAASLALMLPVVGVPFPALRGSERTVVVIDPNAWSDEASVFEGEGSLVGGLPIASRAIVLAEGTGRLVADYGDGWESFLARSQRGYDPDAVIGLALGLLDRTGGRLVLVGVGFAVQDRISSLGSELRARGVTVDVVPAPAPEPAEVWISDRYLPRTLRANEDVNLTFELLGEEAGNRTTVVTIDGERVPTSRMLGSRIVAARNSGLPGVRTVTASIVPADINGRRENDKLTSLVEVDPIGRVALVVRERGDERALVELLVERGFDVVVWTPADVPLSVDELLRFDVVALFDVPALDLHALKQEALESWVREFGGGVLIAGADHAFGPGGYLHTPLETLSALSARVPGDQPKAALAFVLDRSGSMQQAVSGTSRLDVAKEATLSAIDLLHPESQVSVVVFDDIATTLVPLGPPTGVREALAPVGPGGGTNLYAALEAAFAELIKSDAQARHMVVMTDGLAQPNNFDVLIQRIVDADITVSTVAVGRGADIQLLQLIARLGGGAFHASEDVSALPSILSQEAMLLSGSPLQRETIIPVFTPAEAAFVQGLSTSFPPVSGYVRTTAKPESILHASTPDGYPLLASWRHGVGRVVSYAAPLVGERSLPWSDTPFAQTLLERAFRWLVSPATNRGIRMTITRSGDSLLVSALVLGARGAPEEGAQLNLIATMPSGTTLGPVPMTHLGRGEYSAQIPAFEVGIYQLVSLATDLRSQESVEPTTAYFVVSFSAALTPDASRAQGPAALVRETDGRLVLEGRLGPARNFTGVVAGRGNVPWSFVAICATVLALSLEGTSGRRRSSQRTPLRTL